MSVPNVDTFEHDIAEEIKTKEASITDIASAGGDVKNTTPQTSNALVILGLLFVILVIAAVAFLLYLEVKPSTPVQTPQTTTSTVSGPTISSISPALAQALGQSLGTVSKNEYGYAVQIVSYPDVFSYMLRNEAQFADELAVAVGSARDTSTTSEPFTFTDLTLSNQNMRVGTSGSSTVVYAFVNTNALVISSSTSGILQLRSGILTK